MQRSCMLKVLHVLAALQHFCCISAPSVCGQQSFDYNFRCELCITDGCVVSAYLVSSTSAWLRNGGETPAGHAPINRGLVSCNYTCSIEDVGLGEQLGTGNAAQVYKASMNGVPVAIKVAHVDGRFDHDYRSMSCADTLVMEITMYEALKVLQGGIIPKIYAYGLIENRSGDFLPFLAMERIDGSTLDKAVNDMSEEAVAGAFKAVMKAYNKLHAVGYTQGSVKPLNVMLDQHGRALIIDFGRGEKRDCGEERVQVRSMLVKLLVQRLKVGLQEAQTQVLKWEDELSNGEETPSTDETARST